MVACLLVILLTNTTRNHHTPQQLFDGSDARFGIDGKPVLARQIAQTNSCAAQVELWPTFLKADDHIFDDREAWDQHKIMVDHPDPVRDGVG